MSKLPKLPKWFKGEIYNEGDTVRNPFSGEECELNAIELSMYDFIVGSQLVFEMMPGNISEDSIKDFKAGLDWFRKTNPKAYMKLLD